MKLITITFLLIIVNYQLIAQVQPASFKIVGYYSLKAAMSDPDTKSFKYLTHINLWFSILTLWVISPRIWLL
ncbi:MAG: hypothetical protein IPI18_11180 [Saprospiraceae bacterium]|nr:hypothetical protein [Saprospiraceae bacterium]